MDREQEEIQFLGFSGVLRESVNVVSSHGKIFGQITAAFVVPLSFIYLAHFQISQLLFSKIMLNELLLDEIPEGTWPHRRISGVLSSEWTEFLIFKTGYVVVFIVLALLSTSAVVYTIACIYTAQEVTLGKVLSVVPVVWKRVMVTFVWSFLIVFAYNVLSLLLFVSGSVFVGLFAPDAGTAFLVGSGLLYAAGLFYISLVWNLATVVSVLEEGCGGYNAMVKSRGLIRGKMGVSGAVFLAVGLCFFGGEVLFEVWVVVGDGTLITRIAYGVVCLVLVTIAMLMGLVTQTVIYFVCKSYHHENIDKSGLADHLGGYLGDYVPLKSKDVQLGEF